MNEPLDPGACSNAERCLAAEARVRELESALAALWYEADAEFKALIGDVMDYLKVPNVDFSRLEELRARVEESR